MFNIIRNIFRSTLVVCLLVVFSQKVKADAEETWHQKFVYLETVAGYNVNNGDIPIGLALTYQQFRVGPYVSVMYGFRNRLDYIDGEGREYFPTRYGWYASGGVSFRVVGDWSPVDAQMYIGPAWRVVTTARDYKKWDKLSEDQKNDFRPQYIGRWGGELGVRLGGGKAGGKFAVWSGSIGVKIFYIGANRFEFVPQAGLSIALGGPLGIAGGMSLFWL